MRLATALSAVLLVTLGLTGRANAAPIVWAGPEVEFTKVAFDNPEIPENQDFLTDNVILTRANSKGIYNIAQEVEYQGQGVSVSPVGTEWAFGKAADFANHTFAGWSELSGKNPGSLVGEDLTLHLIEDDIYLDLKFTNWGSGPSAGGTFSYVRSTVPEPSLGLLQAVGLGGLALRPSRRRNR